jgi:hypothetical protein
VILCTGQREHGPRYTSRAPFAHTDYGDPVQAHGKPSVTPAPAAVVPCNAGGPDAAASPRRPGAAPGGMLTLA